MIYWIFARVYKAPGLTVVEFGADEGRGEQSEQEHVAGSSHVPRIVVVSKCVTPASTPAASHTCLLHTCAMP